MRKKPKLLNFASFSQFPLTNRRNLDTARSDEELCKRLVIYFDLKLMNFGMFIKNFAELLLFATINLSSRVEVESKLA